MKVEYVHYWSYIVLNHVHCLPVTVDLFSHILINTIQIKTLERNWETDRETSYSFQYITNAVFTLYTLF